MCEIRLYQIKKIKERTKGKERQFGKISKKVKG